MQDQGYPSKYPRHLPMPSPCHLLVLLLLQCKSQSQPASPPPSLPGYQAWASSAGFLGFLGLPGSSWGFPSFARLLTIWKARAAILCYAMLCCAPVVMVVVVVVLEFSLDLLVLPDSIPYHHTSSCLAYLPSS